MFAGDLPMEFVFKGLFYAEKNNEHFLNLQNLFRFVCFFQKMATLDSVTAKGKNAYIIQESFNYSPENTAETTLGTPKYWFISLMGTLRTQEIYYFCSVWLFLDLWWALILNLDPKVIRLLEQKKPTQIRLITLAGGIFCFL